MAPFFGWGSTASRLQSHHEEAVYFLPLQAVHLHETQSKLKPVSYLKLL